MLNINTVDMSEEERVYLIQVLEFNLLELMEGIKKTEKFSINRKEYDRQIEITKKLLSTIN